MVRSAVSMALVALLVLGFAAGASAGMRLGGGIHYLRTVGDLKDTPEFDANSLGFLGALKYKGGLFTVEGAVEVIPDYVGSDKVLWQPQAHLLIGGLIYGGAGIGIGYMSDFGWQDPFYALRAGVDFMLGPVDLDVFASYRFQKSDDLAVLEQDDLDAITFGVLINFGSSGD